WFYHNTNTGQDARLYRLFDFLTSDHRAAGVQRNGRFPGKVNINTMWDGNTLLALASAMPVSSFMETSAANACLYNPANPTAANTIFGRLIGQRTPTGTPGPNDRPFRGLSAGYVPAGNTQFPNGLSIDDTLLRIDPVNP